jgi:hypothetical protein
MKLAVSPNQPCNEMTECAILHHSFSYISIQKILTNGNPFFLLAYVIEFTKHNQETNHYRKNMHKKAIFWFYIGCVYSLPGRFYVAKMSACLLKTG